jgi:hypothetical protein
MLACPAAISLTTFGRKSNMRPKIVKQQGGLGDVQQTALHPITRHRLFIVLLSVTDPAEAVYLFFSAGAGKGPSLSF